MMLGVVSLLDAEHDQQVRAVWAEFERELGLKTELPPPHFSYHIAETYQEGILESALKVYAAQLPSFDVLTAGLGIFTGEHPVLYIALTRSPLLTRIQQDVWPLADAASERASSLYHPDHWMPHITLAQWNINRANLPDVIRLLSERNLYWKVRIDNLALVGADHQVKFRLPIGGRGDKQF
jgi:2'-5' RNA ligase